jgi:hypothetical protein
VPTNPLPTFHYAGGGFPLRHVSYRLQPLGPVGGPIPAYRVIVRVAGDPRPHVLEPRDAVRFLRDLGRLMSCRICGRAVLIRDPFVGQTICDDCGYRAQDG